MKRHLCTPVLLCAVVFLAAPSGWCAEPDLPTALADYDRRVAAITSPADAHVADYLRECLAAAASLNGVTATSLEADSAMRSTVQARRAAFQKLTAADVGALGSAPVTQEHDAYTECLYPFFENNRLAWLRLQNAFLERKYFKTETAKNANFLEGYVNSKWSLTHAHPDELRSTTGPRPLGVSPWEAIFRFEPAAAMRGGPQAAILGTAGLAYTCFPDIDTTKIEAKETFASKYLQKAGIRAGVGAATLSGKTRLLTGPGVQINAVAAWALYDPRDRTWMLGISMADLSKLEKVLGWFK